MRVLVKSAWGSDDPTKAAFPFLHASALVEAGHEAQIFLLGEAVSLIAGARCECRGAGGLAAAGRDAAHDGGARHTNPRLRGLFKGSGSP